MSTFICKIINLFRTFLSSTKANVLIITTTAIVPIFLLTGVVIDYSRIQRAQSTLQSGIDSAAVAVVNHPTFTKLTQSEAKDIALPYIQRHFRNNQDARLLDINVAIDEANLSVEITGDVSVNTTFLSGHQKNIGQSDTLKGGSTSQVSKTLLNLELVFVLDSSGSMLGKMSNLRNITKDVVNQLIPDGAPGANVSIGIVPFSEYVNIGIANRNEDGVFVPDDYTVTEVGEKCRKEYPNSTRQCTKRTISTTCFENQCIPDTYPKQCTRISYDCTKKEEVDCTGELGEAVEVCKPETKSTAYYWFGCVGSRERPLNVVDDTYTSRVQGLMSRKDNCPYANILPLTTNKDDINLAIDSLTAYGETYIPTGLIWGWRMLSNKPPLSQAAVAEPGLQKVMVLMTDGANSKSMELDTDDGSKNNDDGKVWDHDETNVSEANQDMEALCQNIKNDGINLYTISFDIADVTTREMIEDCAGNGGQYYDVKNRVDLAKAFSTIANSLQVVRVVK